MSKGDYKLTNKLISKIRKKGIIYSPILFNKTAIFFYGGAGAIVCSDNLDNELHSFIDVIEVEFKITNANVVCRVEVYDNVANENNNKRSLTMKFFLQ